MATLLENTDDLLENTPEITNGLLEKTFRMMLGVDIEVEESWSKPHEGFQDKEDETTDIDYVKMGRNLISRILSN